MPPSLFARADEGIESLTKLSSPKCLPWHNADVNVECPLSGNIIKRSGHVRGHDAIFAHKVPYLSTVFR